MKTHLPKVDMATKKWYLVDATDKTLGRLAVRIATVLRGKHTPNFTPSIDTGDFVIVINADKIGFTGKKLTDKVYYHHSGHPNGLKAATLERLLARKPEEVIGKAVQGMLPKGPLGRRMFKKLKIYAAAEHPHMAQSPVTLAD